jgi:hypothetical protein
LGVGGLYLIILLLIISSCTDNELKYVAKVPAVGEFKLTSNLDSIVLHEIGGGARTAIVFQCDTMVYSVSTPTIFTIQMDTLNGDFSSPQEDILATNKFEIAYSDSILNKKCLNLLKLKPDVENIVKVRMKATLAYGNLPTYSNVINLKIKPYSVKKIFSYLYMPGIVGGDWNNYSTKICSRNNDGKYEGYVNTAIWANFKFTTKENFSTETGTTIFGSVPNFLYKLNDNTAPLQYNIWFDAAGYFMIKADLNAMTWSKTAITSFSVVGDFNSWNLATNPMTYDVVNKVWTANCNISTIGSGFKIVANADWTYYYGDNDGGKNIGELNFGGGNIVPTATGSKKITMDLSHPEKFTYKIE